MKHARPDYDRIQDPEGKIPDDEPVFLIRGQDVAAPATLYAYAKFAARAGASDALVAATVRHAVAMERWQAQRASKTPDL